MLVEERPRCEVPEDTQHEFLGHWLHVSDPELKSWITWFRQRRVIVAIKIEARTEYGITGRYVMIYTHRFYIPPRGGSARWCCHD